MVVAVAVVVGGVVVVVGKQEEWYLATWGLASSTELPMAPAL